MAKMIDADEVAQPGESVLDAELKAIRLELYVTQQLLTDAVNLMRVAASGNSIDLYMEALRNMKWEETPLPANVVRFGGASQAPGRGYVAIARRMDELRARLFVPIRQRVVSTLSPVGEED